MIYENIELSGSLDVSGSFIVPHGPSSSTPSNPDTGSLFFNTTDSTLYEWVGTWSIVGTQVQPPASADIEYLVVAGGGGGGSLGGGGGGGFLSSSLSAIESGSSFTVTVGAGGSGQIAVGGAAPTSGTSSSLASLTGTSFTTVSTVGGGHGGGSSNAAAQLPENGGSGGGGAGLDATTTAGGSGTSGQGNAGGSGIYVSAGTSGAGGGGGGANASGTNASGNTTGGNGGNGKQSSITGTSTYYAGGGGGGAYTLGGTGTGGSAGLGGATAGQSNNGYSTAGTSNTGGGAGSGGFRSDGWQAGSGAGGSGVVILAYDSGSINGAGGIVGDAGNGRKYHQFNQSGTFKAGSTSNFSIVTDSLGIHLDAGNFASRGASTWTDLSGNGRNGTLSGPTLGNNTYYTFDGSNDYIYIDQFDHTSTNSVEMWYKQNSYVQYATPYAWGYSPSQRWQFFETNQNMYVYFLGSGGTSIYEDSGLDATTSEGWVHIVVTADYTADEYKVYKNGSLITTADLGGQSWSYTGASNAYDYIDIGKNVNNNNGYINSDVGQFRIYTKVLTASEVLQNYNATKTNFV